VNLEGREDGQTNMGPKQCHHKGYFPCQIAVNTIAGPFRACDTWPLRYSRPR